MMTKRTRKLSVTGVVLAGGLLLLGGVFWWYSRSAPAFRFLGDQRPVSHRQYQNRRLDTYTLAGEFESVCAEISSELSRVGCVEVTPPLISNFYREFSRPGFNRIIVRVHRGKFERLNEYTLTTTGEGGVTVEVGRGRPGLWEYLSNRLPGRASPPPGPGPPTEVKPGR